MAIPNVEALQALPEPGTGPSYMDYAAGCCSFTCGSQSCGATCIKQPTLPIKDS
ncbi:listeriolysin S family TOMM bacteriocin [Amycolatopsis azurea]|uniref:Uncharacterized protein n=1 Tax=Amycolatopsis azurea DSM 43854 TaxID=1238180 RepID=M2NTC7_9PSEU|nr:listeriolysin S family TOMM bacteriocin [Amycolatopsis azurea]EMD25669.1 hypothetical protein C791_4563 [Amycolatopsis azurea DSM 43854]